MNLHLRFRTMIRAVSSSPINTPECEEYQFFLMTGLSFGMETHSVRTIVGELWCCHSLMTEQI